MKGTHHIVAETARLKYEFDIRRNITVIRGDSATGKTTLVELLRAYGNRGAESGVTLHSDVPCSVYGGSGDGWEGWIRSQEKAIIFIDEDYSFVQSEKFASCIQKTSNYYVLITRKSLQNLPYSINEIYGIRTVGKYHFPDQIYHEFYRIYSDEAGAGSVPGQVLLITEDSGAGLQFFQKTCGKITCISSNGNSNLYQTVLKAQTDGTMIVLADGAAFGAYIEQILAAVRMRNKTLLYLPESFEWMILRSGVVDGNQVKAILDHPEDYIESSLYFSWEQFFTELLKQYSKDDSRMSYDKANIREFYTGENVSGKILSVLPDDVRSLLSDGSSRGELQAQ